MLSLKGIKHITKNVQIHVWIISGLFFVLIVGVVALTWFTNMKFDNVASDISVLSKELASLESNLATTSALLEEDLSKTRTALSGELEEGKKKASALEEKLGSFKKEVGTISEEVGTISGTVTTLEKLSKTDPELLQKYSKVFFLNEHYVPERLNVIPDVYKYFEERDTQVSAQVYPYLRDMLDRAKSDKVDIFIFSAYRSFDEQKFLKGNYTVTFGAGTANQFSADQGYSEHQLGTTVDLITTGIGGTLHGFENTGAYWWLLANAYKYGFILSYPENNSFYIFEPWHWRFVGVDLAAELNQSGRQFYNLEQREIDKYLVDIFD